MGRILRFFHSIQWKLILIYILLVVIAMQVIGLYFLRSVENYYVRNFSETLNTQANFLAINLSRYFSNDYDQPEQRLRDINYLVENLFVMDQSEVEVIDSNGVILSTSQKDKQLVGRKLSQTEVNRALQGTRNEVIRVDSRTGVRKKFLAVPITSDDQVVGAVYMIASMEEVYQTVRQIAKILASGTLIALLLTTVLGIALARTMTQPIHEITVQARRMAEGAFDREVPVYSQDEIGVLAQTFNEMGKRLGQALKQIEDEHHRLSLILHYMSDGVIATDPEGRILLMNQRAQRLLGRTDENVEGMALDALLAPYDLTFPKERETFHTIRVETGEGETFIRFIWSPLLSDAEQVVIGGIVILQDVTQQERLDRQRKEFVANVSHELRTPLAGLKSYLEALEQGALTDPELGPKFLKVAHHETDRMSRLIHDLLQLSRLDSGQAVLRRDRVDIGEVMEDVMDRFSFQIKKKRLHATLQTKMNEPPVIIGDRDQIDQVMDNLLSNAIKYTPEQGEIRVTIETNLEAVEIRIADTGIGIPKEDLPRVFERFYRVDKARSRTMGGTGLGLAIAREIVRAHQGTIQVDSEWSVGTVVTVSLPRAGE